MSQILKITITIDTIRDMCKPSTAYDVSIDYLTMGNLYYKDVKRLSKAVRRAVGKRIHDDLCAMRGPDVKIVDSSHLLIGVTRIRTPTPLLYKSIWYVNNILQKLLPPTNESLVPEKFHAMLTNLWSTTNIQQIATEYGVCIGILNDYLNNT